MIGAQILYMTYPDVFHRVIHQLINILCEKLDLGGQPLKAVQAIVSLGGSASVRASLLVDDVDVGEGGRAGRPFDPVREYFRGYLAEPRNAPRQYSRQGLS